MEIRYCDVCGVSSEKKRVKRSYGKTLCEKHVFQFRKYGRFFDTNQITVKDPNEIEFVDENHANILLYDKYGNVTAKALIDAEDVERVRGYRWMACVKRRKTYVRANNCGHPIYLHRYLLNYEGENEVDHEDGESLNNTKRNLRITDRPDNILNVAPHHNNKLGIRGVSYDRFHETYNVDFSYRKVRFYFKPFKTLEPAVYLRYLCETNYFGEYRYESNDEVIMNHISKLSEDKKQEVEQYFESKKQQYAERIA